MQHGVAGPVGRGAGALGWRAFAKLRGHATKRALIDAAILGPAEGDAVVFELVDGGGRIAAQVFDRVLVAEPVGALDGVEHMPLPAVGPHVAERGGHATLRRDRVRAGREDLRDARRFQTCLGRTQGRAQSSAAGADHDHIEGVIRNGIGASIDGGLCYAIGGAICLLSHRSSPKTQFQYGIYGRERHEDRKEGVQHQGCDL